MIKSLTKLSQILASTGISISSSQEEQILTTVKKLNIAPHPQEDLEVSFDSLFKCIEETEASWTTFDGGQPLELEIDKFLISLSEEPLCTNETSQLKEDDSQGMIEGDMHIGLNKQVNQEHHEYIEHWLHKTTRLNHHSLFQQLFTSSPKPLILRTMVYIKASLSNPSMNVFIHMLRTWLHFKYSYT
jgi:hypothetical protein